MTYKVGQKLIYIKNNDQIHLSNRYFLRGYGYIITRIDRNYIYIRSRKLDRWGEIIISPFKINILSKYFKHTTLNPNTTVL